MKTGRLTRRNALAAGLSIVLLPRFASAQSSKREIEGGIGGTGIVGILTDTTTLIVSGNALQIDATTRLSDPFGEIGNDILRVGDSLTVEAAQSKGSLIAKRVHITYPLVGEVSARSNSGLGLVVNNVQVRAERPLVGITVGDRVFVSGLWRGKEVIASRVSKTREPLDLVSGDIRRSFGQIQIGATNIRGRGATALQEGAFATALGRFDRANSRFVAERLEANRFTGAAGQLERLSIEGYLEPIATAPGFRIAGLGHSFARNLRLDEYENARVLFNGPYTGKFAANSAVVLPQDANQRRALLARLSRTAG